MKLVRKVKNILMGIAKKHIIFRKVARKIVYCYRCTRFFIRTRFKPIDDKTVWFQAFNGKSYSCSPKAIYEFMINSKEYQTYTFIWSFKEPEKYKFLEKNRNTIVIQNNCRKFEKMLGKAKYWITNYRVLDHIWPKKSQVYVQCWHGIPLKRLGYDLQNTKNAMNSTNEIFFKYRTDAQKFKYIISPCKFSSEKFASAWNLEKFNSKGKSAIIEEGYPRNDRLLTYNSCEVQKIKDELGLDDKGKKIILYAPTWRDNQHNVDIGYTYKMNVDFDKLQKELSKEYIILFRAHYLVSNRFEFEKYQGFIYDVSNVDDINDLYIISDILVTDYSSVFFDYANLKKPVIFYMYDLHEYQDEIRGFYLSLDELPGKITQTEDELIKEIEEVSKEFKYDEKYEKFNQRFNNLNDGKASERVISKIINKKSKKE